MSQRGWGPQRRLAEGQVVMLTAALALAAFPLALHRPLWVQGLGLGIFCWRLLATTRRVPLPRRWINLSLAVVVTLGVVATHGTVVGREAGSTLLFTMVALKLLETQTERDAYVALTLGYFLLLAQYLHSQSLPVAAHSVVALVALTAVLVQLNRHVAPAPLSHGLRTAGGLLLQALPFALVLFMLFPRISGPLWGRPSPEGGAAVTGLSSRLAPGSISQMTLSDAVAFRAKFDSEPPTPSQLYWRGLVLWAYDGRQWVPGRKPLEQRPPLSPRTPSVDYEVTIEPHQRKWLFALDLPTAISGRHYLTADFLARSRESVEQVRRYRVESIPRYRMDTRLSPSTRQAALALPEDAAPRTRRLARQWREEVDEPRALVQRALAYFQERSFVYTLRPPAVPDRPVDRFVFDTRRGFCGHYASSFAVMMRAAGVPTRVVVGYQGGEHNPMGDYYIVRQANAHAWAEVWLPGAGWQRVDPTAAVAPRRIEDGLNAAVPEADRQRAATPSGGAWHQVGLAWDSVNNAWNRWVLGYGAERQRQMLQSLGMGRDVQILIGILAAIMGGLLALTTALVLWPSSAQGRDPVQRHYERFCRKLARAGLPRPANEGPEDFARRVAEARPDLATGVHEITRLYVALRYGPRPDADPARIRRLRDRVTALSP